MHAPKTSLRRAFTIVEMLVVMVIMAATFGLIIPVAVDSTQATKLTTGGAMVNNLIALARQRAATHNTLTALVLLGSHGSSEDYRSMAVLQYDAQQGWKNISEWETLPEGIIVDVNNKDLCTFLKHTPAPLPYATVDPETDRSPIRYQASVITNTAYAARIFLPSGKLMDSEVSSHIRLVEGHLQGDAIIYNRAGNAENVANYIDITILGASGMTKISRPGQS